MNKDDLKVIKEVIEELEYIHGLAWQIQTKMPDTGQLGSIYLASQQLANRLRVEYGGD